MGILLSVNRLQISEVFLAHAVRVVEEDSEVVDVPAAYKDGVDVADGVALVDRALLELTGPGVALELCVIGPLPTGHLVMLK